MVDKQTGHYVILLENGKQLPLPPNVHRVPTLIVRNSYVAIEGNNIIERYQPIAQQQESAVLEPHGGEPEGFDLMSVRADQYTFTDGRPENRVLYVDANHSVKPIQAAPDTYRSNKLSPEITIEMLEKQREETNLL